MHISNTLVDNQSVGKQSYSIQQITSGSSSAAQFTTSTNGITNLIVNTIVNTQSMVDNSYIIKQITVPTSLNQVFLQTTSNGVGVSTMASARIRNTTVNSELLINRRKLIATIAPIYLFNTVIDIGLVLDWASYFTAYSPELNMVVSTWYPYITTDGGYSWTASPSPYVDVDAAGIFWVPELSKFFLSYANNIGGDPSAHIATYDGTTWSTVTSPAGVWGNIAWSNELSLFVVIEELTNRAMISSDLGVTWTTQTTAGNAALDWWDITYSPTLELFVTGAYTDNSENLMTYDGTTWTTQTNPTGLSVYNTKWVDFLGLFIAAGQGYVIISFNGIDWQSVPVPLNIPYNGGIAVCEKYSLVMINSYDDTRIIYSKNGFEWFELNKNIDIPQTYGFIWDSGHETFITQSQNAGNASAVVGIL
jgi:hypothetical protein